MFLDCFDVVREQTDHWLSIGKSRQTDSPSGLALFKIINPLVIPAGPPGSIGAYQKNQRLHCEVWQKGTGRSFGAPISF